MSPGLPGREWGLPHLSGERGLSRCWTCERAVSLLALLPLHLLALGEGPGLGPVPVAGQLGVQLRVSGQEGGVTPCPDS